VGKRRQIALRRRAPWVHPVLLIMATHLACGCLQDVEKLGSKRGVVLQSVKEVLQVCGCCCGWGRGSRHMGACAGCWCSSPPACAWLSASLPPSAFQPETPFSLQMLPHKSLYRTLLRSVQPTCFLSLPVPPPLPLQSTCVPLPSPAFPPASWPLIPALPPAPMQTLVDDDLVHGEKIGISNYFWAFPSEQAVKLDGQVAQLQRRLQVRRGGRRRSGAAARGQAAVADANGDVVGGGPWRLACRLTPPMFGANSMLPAGAARGAGCATEAAGAEQSGQGGQREL
jgi:hypothetical protein